MKKIITVIAVVVIAVSSALPQQLRKVVTKSLNYSLSDVTFLNENLGWCTGYSESILKTTDGGITWATLHEVPGSSRTLSAIQFIDENLGYAAGGSSSDSLFLKTTDGGTTWTEMVVPWGNAVVGISFIDANTGWTLTSSSSAADAWKTTDGGLNWVNVLTFTSGDLEAIDVRPSGRGVITGGGVGKLDLFYTSDGTNWTKAPAPGVGPTYSRLDIRAVTLVDDNLVYACGWGSYIGIQPSLFLKSTDGGASWTTLVQLPENRVYANMNAIYFKDADNGIAFGGDAYSGTICTRTSDGGVTWIQLPTGQGFSGNACAAIGDKVWVTGGDGIVYTPDFGNSFQLLTPVISSSLYDIKTIGHNVYAGGYTGAFFKSTDKGETWRTYYAATGKISPHINALYFLNEQVGFAARNNQLVSKTTDAGETWFTIMKDSSATGMNNTGVWFMDENTGYVAGKIATNTDKIYSTTDGGVNWASVGPTAGKDLNDLAFGDANTGVAVGNDFKVIYTANAGAIWSVATINNRPTTDLDIKDVVFLTPTNVVAVGEKCYILSTDGGATWEYKEITGFTKTLEGVAFKDANEGWAVGNRFIYHTTNGGLEWADVSDTLVTLSNANLYSAAVDTAGYLWICGGSEVFTYSPQVVSVEDNHIPAGYELSQNYPNPFNPVTNISYSIPVQSHVVINVYDVLGNLVRQLINETKSAGEYKVNFNAGSISSGIYFFRMSAGDKTFTRKMTLLK